MIPVCHYITLQSSLSEIYNFFKLISSLFYLYQTTTCLFEDPFVGNERTFAKSVPFYLLKQTDVFGGVRAIFQTRFTFFIIFSTSTFSSHFLTYFLSH